jgi:hypothetical protein
LTAKIHYQYLFGCRYCLETLLDVFLFFETGKNRRLKQAKEEAQAEIEQYRLQREKEFKAKEAAVGLPLFVFTIAFLFCADLKRVSTA